MCVDRIGIQLSIYDAKMNGTHWPNKFDFNTSFASACIYLNPDWFKDGFRGQTWNAGKLQHT